MKRWNPYLVYTVGVVGVYRPDVSVDESVLYVILHEERVGIAEVVADDDDDPEEEGVD